MRIIHRLGWLLLAPIIFAPSAMAARTPSHHTTQSTDLLAPGYKICVIGDVGTGDANQYHVAQALETERCDQIRVIGDLIYPKGLKSASDPQYQEKFYLPYQRLIESAKGPLFFMALGNHDYKSNPRAWLDLAKQNDYLFFPNRYYSESYENSGICIATLDTAPFDSLNHFLKAFGHGSWLRKTLRHFQPDCRFSIAFAHHPFRNHGHHGHAKAFLKRFLKRNVVGRFDLFIAGHEHLLADEGTRHGTALYISGAGAKLEGPSETSDGGYSAAQLGYITLEFAKNTENKITAQAEFRVIDAAGNISTAHEREIVGQGIRD